MFAARAGARKGEFLMIQLPQRTKSSLSESESCIQYSIYVCRSGTDDDYCFVALFMTFLKFMESNVVG